MRPCRFSPKSTVLPNNNTIFPPWANLKCFEPCCYSACAVDLLLGTGSNYYFHRFAGRNPFGFSGRRIGDLYAGLVKDASKATEWKKYRVTKHTHDPVDDARGNAEALKKFRELGLKI